MDSQLRRASGLAAGAAPRPMSMAVVHGLRENYSRSRTGAHGNEVLVNLDLMSGTGPGIELGPSTNAQGHSPKRLARHERTCGSPKANLQVSRMAGRQGVFTAVFRNPNKDERF